ncbi:MAG: hypothetical protein ACI9FR_001219 [Cryomorphaceae bacterium]|jgi:hypothetical protein
MLSKLINSMGVYFGAEGDSIGANEENPRGFWERKDVRDLNDYLLHSAGNDWDKLSGFNMSALDNRHLEHFEQRATEIINKLDQNAPWFIKEPRICVLIAAWQEVLSSPVYIHIYRNPIEVASSLFHRNNISIPEGIALWEKYNIDALNGTQNANRILVSHSRLLSNPVQEIKSLFDRLTAYEVENIRMPKDGEITSFVDVSLYRQRYGQADLQSYLNLQQLELFNKLEDGSIFESDNEINLSQSGVLVLENYHEQCNRIERAAQEIVNLGHQKKELENQKAEVVELAESYSNNFAAVFESNRWKLGDRLVSFVKRVKGHKDNQAAAHRWVEECDQELVKHVKAVNKKRLK